MKVDTKSQSGVAFHLIAGCLFPFAFYVALSEMFMLSLTASTAMMISLALLVIYAFSYAAFRHLIFTFFMLAYSIALIYSTVYAIIPDVSFQVVAYLSMLVGAGLIYIGSTFKGTHNAPLSDMLYFFGSAAVLVNPAGLFGTTPAWQLMYPFLIAFMLYVALLVHSKRILTVCVLAIMGYVIYLTGKYFADVVGWPIALVITGILLIAIGYLAVKYKEKV